MHGTEALRELESGSKLPLMVGAIIYVRVSTKEQTENLSLPTQLRACEEYCRREGYEILERFREEGESAKTADRPQLQRLLKYCRTNKGKVHFVVVFNLTRFAREKYDHFALRSHLKSLGISLRSATEPIDDTSTGKLMEGVLASFAQFDNDVRSDRTRAGMKAALELGRWTFLAPIGYINVPRTYGKSLIPDPERAAVVQQIFRDFATGRFTKQELLDEMTRQGLKTRKGLPVSSQAFATMLENQLYVGIVNAPGYGVVGKRGDFDPLIPDDVFYRVQAILTGRVQTSGPYQRRRPEFPLTGVHQVRGVRTGCHRQLVEGTQCAIRVLPLPATLPGGEYPEGHDSKGCSWTNWNDSSRRPVTCGSSRSQCCAFGTTARRRSRGGSER